ncbi:MAG: lactate utilization protein [Deltaproteobacteria bacterium]|nr:lactate utilization protein [Deltaproteobacteria bacterium]
METEMAILKKARQELQQINVEQVLQSLRKNQIDALYVANRQEAVKEILALIPEGSTVGYGGSLTLDELGIKEVLQKGNYKYIDRGRPGISPEEMFTLRRECLLADVFLCSTNALTRDGKLVNIDGVGNRLAALTFGPKKVIVVAGLNKIVDDVEKGLTRIRSHVAPLHARRRGWKVPCAQTGTCMDCRSPDRICNILSVVEFQREKGRLTVVLVGQSLGL